jgi:CHAD domain-containing protein
MKHTAILKVVDKRMRRIGNHYKLVKEDYAAEHIHDLRVEVKKVRAFLALVNMSQPAKMPLSIHPDIKQFYTVAGEFRNLQLQQQRIVLWCSEQLLQPPDYYLEYLYDRQQTLQQVLQSMVIDAAHCRRLLLHELPATISKKALDKFAEEKAFAIHQLMQMPIDDNVLHEIRKEYKMVLYNLPYLAKRQTPACENFTANKEAIIFTTDALGDYHDLHTALYLLWYYTINQYNLTEKPALLSLEESFLNEKLLLKPEIIRQLHIMAGTNAAETVEA